MKASEIMFDIIGKDFYEANKEWTCDTVKAGDPDKEVKKIGTCLAATPDVLRAAAANGTDLLITHEPTYYLMSDTPDDSPMSQKKDAIIKESGMTIWRYHDAMHLKAVDEINEAFIAKLGLKGEFDGQMGFVLSEAATPTELASHAAKALGLAHPRIIGCREGLVTKLSLFLGQRQDKYYEDFMAADTELCFSGEICEWKSGEPVRDACQLGIQKAIVVLGHAGSEKIGMELLAEKLNNKYGAPARYFECGELYTY